MFERNKSGQLVWVADIDRLFYSKQMREPLTAAMEEARQRFAGGGSTYGPGGYRYPALRAQEDAPTSCRRAA